jgi:hypothetical protein
MRLAEEKNYEWKIGKKNMVVLFEIGLRI